MKPTKRSQAEMELIQEFQMFDLTRKSSQEVVKPSRFKVEGKPPLPIPAPREARNLPLKKPPPPPPSTSRLREPEMPDIVKTTDRVKIVKQSSFCFLSVSLIFCTYLYISSVLIFPCLSDCLFVRLSVCPSTCLSDCLIVGLSRYQIGRAHV